MTAAIFHILNANTVISLTKVRLSRAMRLKVRLSRAMRLNN
jgi:hypothetical protein